MCMCVFLCISKHISSNVCSCVFLSVCYVCFLFSLSRIAQLSRVESPCLVSRRIESRSVMSRRVAARRSYKTVFTLIKFQIKCNNADPPPPHTPPHPLTLLEYQPASFCLRLSPSLSLTLLLALNRAQKSTTIQNKRRRQSRTRAAAAAILNKNANNNKVCTTLSTLSLSVS